jgi:condensin-2 complex subunit D3
MPATSSFTTKTITSSGVESSASDIVQALLDGGSVVLEGFGDDGDDAELRQVDLLQQLLDRLPPVPTNHRTEHDSDGGFLGSRERRRRPRDDDDVLDDDLYQAPSLTTTGANNALRRADDDDNRDDGEMEESNQVSSIRSILGATASTSAGVAHLLEVLGYGMGRRVDPSELLPLTCDDQANDLAMWDVAITLTDLAIQSAAVYARLLDLPGALGGGWVDVGTLQLLAAVVERWATECRGKEKDFDGSRHGNRDRRNKQQRKATTGVRGQRRRPQNQPVKRKKKSPRSAEYISSSDDDGDDQSGPDEEEVDRGGLDGLVLEVINETKPGPSRKLTPSRLLSGGLLVAGLVSRLPKTREFFGWSEEARDVVIAASATALAVTSSLQQAKRLPPPTAEHVSSTLTSACDSLSRCIPMAKSEVLDSEVLTKRVHATRSILKGMHPLLLFQRELPVGQKGKQAAADAASRVIEQLIANVAADIENNPHSWPKNPLLGASSPVSGSASQLLSPSTQAGHGSPAARTPKTANKTPRRTPFSKVRRFSAVSPAMTPLRLKRSTIMPGTMSLVSPASVLKMSPSSSKPRPVLREILALFQRLALDPGLEVASTRHHVVDTVTRCIPFVPPYERSMLMSCLGNLLRSKWWYCRLVSCEVSIRALQEPWFWLQDGDVDRRISIDRTSVDVFTPGTNQAPRTRAVSLRDQAAEMVLEGLVGRLDDKDRNLRISCANGLTLLLETIRSDATHERVRELLVRLLCNQSIVLSQVLRASCLQEDKALARKALIGALAELLVTGLSIPDINCSPTSEDVLILSRFCQDISQETRRAAAEALTAILQAYQDRNPSETDEMLQELESAWSDSVLPLASESDSRLVSKLVSLFDCVVFKPIVMRDGSSAQSRSAWRIVVDASVHGGGLEFLSTLLRRKAAESQARGEVLSPLVTKVVDVASSTVLNSSDGMRPVPIFQVQRDGAWCLLKALLTAASGLSELVRQLRKSKHGLSFIVDCWYQMIKSVAPTEVLEEGDGLLRSMGNCLEVIAALSPHFEVGVATGVAASIEKRLAEFSVPTAVIGFAVTALAALTVALADSNDVKVIQRACARKILALFDTCEKEITRSLQNEIGADEETRLVRALCTSGELCLVGFSEDEDSSSSTAAKQDRNRSDALVGIHERPSPRLVQLIQTLMSRTLPGSESVTNPPGVRSMAVLTLGKMCLRNESLTIQSVTLFARELHEAGNGSPDVQANALIVLGDLCVRYANHVDRFLPVMATCLQAGASKDINVLDAPKSDGYEIVRVQAIHLLSNLIMQDYIKWRGLLFHRFLVATADEADHVSLVAKQTLCGPLLTKKQQLFVQNFVEALFVLNRCTTHPIYKAASVSGDGGSGTLVDFEGIYLDGSLGSHRRFAIYRMMLSKMSDEQKIEVTARLAKDVLGNALEEGNDIHRLCHFANPEGLDLEIHPSYSRAYHVLRDALVILRSKLLRVSRRRAPETSGDEAESRSDRVASLKGEFLSKINRTQLIDMIVPKLVRLKETLQKNRSPLLQDLMGYLLAMFESYPDHFRDILRNEPQVLAEIEYDIRATKRSKQALRESDSFTT